MLSIGLHFSMMEQQLFLVLYLPQTVVMVLALYLLTVKSI